MHFSVLVVAGYLHILRIQVKSEEISVTREPDGDIFTVGESSTEACSVLSSGTASPFSYSPSSGGIQIPNNSCTCQCNSKFPIFREDLSICVEDIHECATANFISSPGVAEKVPYVFLPQRGQIIHRNAELHFEGVKVPVCVVAGAQQLGRSGWSELRNLSDAEPPLRLFRNEGRTYLQWVGDSALREAAEGRVVVARLLCRDAAPEPEIRGAFTPCAAFRVAGTPARSGIREVTFVANAQASQGLSTVEYTAIGLSSVLVGFIYVASVLLYLHSRKVRKRRTEEPEVGLSNGRDIVGVVKNNPLLSAARHFESDTTSGLSGSEIGDELPLSDGEQGFENITSAIIHPHYAYLESEGIFGSGSILGERLPEEDVRIVETIDNANHHDSPTLPGTQRRKLYFNPAYFDRQLLLAPPPAAIEFLHKIREVISIAKHKMAAKRFVPTLVAIQEEDGVSEQQRNPRGSSIRGSVTRSRKSQGCTGCPGCRDRQVSLPAIPVPSHPCLGENRIRAWLENVKPPEKKWRDAEDSRRNFAENARTFAKNLEYLREMARHDFIVPEKLSVTNRSISSWKDNPAMVRTFRNIARSEIFENDDNFSISKKSTRSMFEEPTYSRYANSRCRDLEIDDAVNAKVRKAIEISFIEQMQENAALECLQPLDERLNGSPAAKIPQKDARSPIQSQESIGRSSSESASTSAAKRPKKYRAPSAPKKLPDMIKELPKVNVPARKLMDEVIQEMTGFKAIEHHSRSTKNIDYEVDSLERSKSSLKSSSSPECTSHSSPALSTALPMDEELTMQNAIFNTKTGSMTISKMTNEALENHRNSNGSIGSIGMPELLVVPRGQTYSLVSEVYVNDGYASPTGSDSSGPEIQYEPENPGHLTIKVLDSPDNYVKQDESEYEPDTLDRKSTKLKVNGDATNYEKGVIDEVFADSLERPAHISLRSKGSFRIDVPEANDKTPIQRQYGSLREIYEARLRANLKNSALLLGGSTRSLNTDSENDSAGTLGSKKYLTPDTRQAKRQRRPQNHPDVVPMPPAESIYQQPKPPRPVEILRSTKPTTASASKNARDRSRVDAGSPTAGDVASVPKDLYTVGNSEELGEGNCLYCHKRTEKSNGYGRSTMLDSHPDEIISPHRSTIPDEDDDDDNSDGHGTPKNDRRKSSARDNENLREASTAASMVEKSNSLGKKKLSSSSSRTPECEWRRTRSLSQGARVASDSTDVIHSSPTQFGTDSEKTRVTSVNLRVEDSGYLSSTDSNGSRKQLLRYDVRSVSETDDTESVCDGASESGAESIGTDSVFFGNFRKSSEWSNFSKSVDSGVDVNVRNPYFQAFGIRNEGGVLERPICSNSDSETESFVTVMPPCGSQRNSLVL